MAGMVNQHEITPYSDESWQKSEDQCDPQDLESRGLLTDSHVESRISQSLRWQTKTSIVAITIFNVALFSFSILSLGTTWYYQGLLIANAELRRISIYS
jgi:hypothetical protein